MAHKIDHSTGKAAFIAFQAPAWHNLGKVFNSEITYEDALRDSGLNFEVVKLPNIHTIPGMDPITSEESFFTYRTDVNKVLGTRLGKDYTVYQNTEALAVVDEMLKTGKVKIETAGAVDNGKRAFICLKIQSAIIIDGKDPIEQYVLLANSHDGTLAITAMPSNVRVVCWNTLSAALAGAKPHHKIRHTVNANDRVKEAFKIMGILEQNQKSNEAAYNAMRCNMITKHEFFDYVGNIFLTPEEISQMQKGDKDALSTRKKNIIKGVMDFAETGIGQREALGTGNMNMWWAYNGITGYLTSKKYSSADDRFNSLILGDSATKIKAAGDLAISTQNIKSLKCNVSAGMNLN